MNGARRDGLMLLLLGSVVFVLLGLALQNISQFPLVDFRAMYYPARCLLEGGDPYSAIEVERVYRTEGVYGATDTAKEREMATRFGYLPSAFAVTAPFALLPWGPARILWIALTAGGLIFASLLLWGIGANYAPIVSGCLIGFVLANSELLIDQGMCAGIAVSLCIVAAWCFLENRFVTAGVLCLAFGLALKPQDTGLVWLYFLLCGGVCRRRALQAFTAALVIGLPALLSVWRVAPHWIDELHANIAAFAAHGGINDPGPASQGGHGLANIISLQSLLSLVRDEPRFYNSVSYLICAPLLLAWGIVTLRSRFSKANAWLGLATIAALTLLPVYHRQYDAKLLLLAIPACVLLWIQGGLTGKLAMLVTGSALFFTGDLTWAMFLALVKRVPLAPGGFAGRLSTALQVVPAPLILLIMGVFYLWVYARATRRDLSAPRIQENP